MTFRQFKQKAKQNRSKLRRFMTGLENNTPAGLDKTAAVLSQEVWAEVDCLACANCCKTMTPTFTTADIKRIAAHLQMTPQQFADKWLLKEKTGAKDWINKTEPCQFLNLEDNKCSIYEVRPEDCAGFPHLTKKKMVDYMHVHKQNIEYCPATYALIEKMKAASAKK
jgi:Fe-S-cluster containining protein